MMALAGWKATLWRWLGWKKPTARRPRRAAPVAAPVARESFIDAVRRMVAADPGLETRLHIVSVADFRDSVGEKWPRLADKVAMIAHMIITRHLGHGNLYGRHGEDCFLLLFPAATRDQARERTIAITRDLSRHLLGDGIIGGERPVALMANMALRDAVTGKGGFNGSAVTRAVDECRAAIAAPGFRVARSATSELCWEKLEALARADGGTPPEWQSFRLTSGGKNDRSEPWDAVPPLPPGARLSLLWRPTWVAEGEAISAYTARVVRIDHDGAAPLEGSLAYPPEDPLSAMTLDAYLVGAAVRQLRADGLTTTAIIPVNWTSLLADDRMRIVLPFAELDGETRARRIKIEIFRIPDTATAEEFRKVADAVHALGCETMMRLRLSSRSLPQAARSGADLIGLDLSELRADEHMGDDALLGALDNMQGEAMRAGVSCYLWGARRRRIVGQVMLGGFHMVNGPGLMKDVSRPAVVLPAPRDRFADLPGTR